MLAIRKTVLETLVLGLLALALGFGANAVRGSHSINPTRNYFYKGEAPTTLADAAAAAKGDVTMDATTAGRSAESLSSSGARLAPAAKKAASSSAVKHPEHPYQNVEFERVKALFEDPATAAGVNLFVDARNDDAFVLGHVPGAVQCDHYRLENYLDRVLQAVELADAVVVYCNGGDCEDSIFVCADLIEAGVPYEKVFLYAGGWKEWTDNGLPVATGWEDRP